MARPHIQIKAAAKRFTCNAQRYMLSKRMTQSFKDADAQELFETGSSKRWKIVERSARRKLDQIETASSLADLRIPPGNHLEASKGDRAGQHSIRINDQFRICFKWKPDGAHEVEITDYH